MTTINIATKKAINAVVHIFRLLLFFISNVLGFVFGVPLLLLGVSLLFITILICSTAYSILEWSKRSGQSNLKAEDGQTVGTIPNPVLSFDLVKTVEPDTSNLQNPRIYLKF